MADLGLWASVLIFVLGVPISILGVMIGIALAGLLA